MTKTFADQCLERAEKSTPPERRWGQVDKVYDNAFTSVGPITLTEEQAELDARFIAHARTDVPELARRLTIALDFIIQALPYSDHAQELVNKLEAMPGVQR